MELGTGILKTRVKRSEFLSKEIISKVLNKKNTGRKISSKLERVDSSQTTIDNVKVSITQNNETLIKNLRLPNFERSQCELRQILRLPSKLRERSEEIRKKSSFHKNFRVQRISVQAQKKIFETKFLSPENLRLGRGKNIREYFNDFYKEDHKKNAELLPISLQHKKTLEPIRNGSKKNTVKGKYLQYDYKNKEDQFTFFALNKSQSGSSGIGKYLKDSDKPINDWKNSVLYQNIKYNRESPVMFDGYYKTELTNLAFRIPLDSSISLILERLFCTLEKLFIQLLGSKEDLEQVQQNYGKASVSNVQFLIEKCLILYKFRDRTYWIIERILRREMILKEVILGNMKSSNELFRITEKLQKKIKRWLRDEYSPYTEFVFNGINYLFKMDKDIELLQDLKYVFKD